jgi:hypothetical protein
VWPADLRLAAFRWQGAASQDRPGALVVAPGSAAPPGPRLISELGAAARGVRAPVRLAALMGVEGDGGDLHRSAEARAVRH